MKTAATSAGGAYGQNFGYAKSDPARLGTSQRGYAPPAAPNLDSKRSLTTETRVTLSKDHRSTRTSGSQTRFCSRAQVAQSRCTQVRQFRWAWKKRSEQGSIANNAVYSSQVAACR